MDRSISNENVNGGLNSERRTILSLVKLEGKPSNGTHQKEENPEKTHNGLSALPASKKLALFLLWATQFTRQAAVSCVGPFFPNEARQKGVSQTKIGLAFSVYEAICFITTPLFGAFVSTVDATFMFVTAIFPTGVGSILFGILKYCPTGDIFLAMSLLVRTMEGIALAAYSIATYLMIVRVFPDQMATVFGILEISTSLGGMAGPVIGGILYKLGGYGLPFYSLGGVIIMNGLLLLIFFPSTPDTEHTSKKSIPWEALLRKSVVWVGFIVITFAGSSNLFILSSLALHLKTLGIDVAYNGFIFACLALSFALCGPLAGMIIDRRGNIHVLMISGSVATFVSYMLLGPSPILSDMFHLKGNIPILCFALVLVGGSQGVLFVSSNKCLIIGAQEASSESASDGYGKAGALYNTAISLGGVVGPAIGGAFIDKIGFVMTTAIFAAVFLILSLALVLYFSIRLNFYKTKDSQLLHTEETIYISSVCDGSPGPNPLTSNKAPTYDSFKPTE